MAQWDLVTAGCRDGCMGEGKKTRMTLGFQSGCQSRWRYHLPRQATPGEEQAEVRGRATVILISDTWRYRCPRSPGNGLCRSEHLMGERWGAGLVRGQEGLPTVDLCANRVRGQLAPLILAKKS